MSDRSTASHAIEERIGKRAQLQRALRPQHVGWVASLAVSGKKPRVDEQAAADAICAVEELLEPPEFEPNGRDTAPDWRVGMTDGRIADVEVIRCTDEDAVWFMQSRSPDGSARVWPDARLSYEWTIVVSDHSPTTNRSLGLGKMMDAVRYVLVSVEGEHDSPEQMRETARWELRLNAEAGHYVGSSRYIYVAKKPHHVGDERGSVRTYGSTSQGGVIHHERLIPPIQQCIDHKESDARLDGAPDLKWLAVMPEGEPAWLLNDFFGPHSPSPPPSLDGISFDYFDECGWSPGRASERTTRKASWWCACPSTVIRSSITSCLVSQQRRPDTQTDSSAAWRDGGRDHSRQQY